MPHPFQRNQYIADAGKDCNFLADMGLRCRLRLRPGPSAKDTLSHFICRAHDGFTLLRGISGWELLSYTYLRVRHWSPLSPSPKGGLS